MSLHRKPILLLALIACDQRSVVKLNPISGLQQLSCDDQTDCPSPFVCQKGFCQKACKTNADCDANQVCNAELLCVAATVVKKPGEACTETRECDAANSCQGGKCATAPTMTGQTGQNPGTFAPGCGNNQLDAGEACDDGNVGSGDYCAADCKTVIGRCGDGMKQINEACDDGDTLDTNLCAGDCTRIHTCGDGSVQSNELCDDGNTLAGDYCSVDCQSLTGRCGDSNLQTNEACDDGNVSDGDYCPGNCLGTPGQSLGGSNDGIVQTNEACDGSYAVNGLTMCRQGAIEADGYIGGSAGGCDRGVVQCPAGQRMTGFDFSWNRINGGPMPRGYRPIVGFRVACESGTVDTAASSCGAPAYYSNLPGLCCHGAGETEFSYPSPNTLPTVSVRCPQGQYVVGGRGWETWYANTGNVRVLGWLSARCQGPDLSAPLTTTTTAGDTVVDASTVNSTAIDFVCPPGKLLLGFHARAGDVFDGIRPICQQ